MRSQSFRYGFIFIDWMHAVLPRPRINFHFIAGHMALLIDGAG